LLVGGGALLLAGAGAAALLSRSGRGRATLTGLAGAAGLALLLAPDLAAMPGDARRVLAAAVLMAIWWITVAIPIPATSLLPLVLLPVLGVLPSGATAANYANDNVFLFLGGFVLALGIQRWGLHRRIALTIVKAVGTNPARMVLGFMLATAFLSMWISNTATTLMMLPIALAVVTSLSEAGGRAATRELAPALLLGVAYAASIGGLATPIGTPPNISFLRILQILHPEAPSFSFGRWTLAFLPLTALFLPLAWLLLTRLLHRLPNRRIDRAERVVAGSLERLGRMGPAERRMLWIFAATALLWLSRGDLDLGSVRIPGWASLVEGWVGGPFAAGNLHDATVAVAMAVLTFLVPGDPDPEGRPRRLMDWETARQLPWGILLLFGGGFALASAFKESGLSLYLGESFAGRLAGAGPVTLVASTSLLMTFLTEVTSNTATTEVSLPVLGGAAGALGIHPLLLMLPATLSASCAFMLPIATPPNAIVFGSGHLEMRQMVRAGLLLNLLGVVLITATLLWVSAPLLGVDLGSVPAWAR
ncbi:MAG: SLC13 family permease, partial [Thermoanaerobaculia bacterium]|nr:SLC13 family permease [Thermoanaerobaculia bacterium]